MKEEIIKILFKHRANDRGNKDLNLFDDKKQLEEEDSYYADMILDLFQKEKIIQITTAGSENGSWLFALTENGRIFGKGSLPNGDWKEMESPIVERPISKR